MVLEQYVLGFFFNLTTNDSHYQSPYGSFKSFCPHSSYHPGVSLVNKQLNGDNYTTWSKSMSIALSVSAKKNCFVDGLIQ